MKRLNLLILAIIVSFSVSAQMDTTHRMHQNGNKNYNGYVYKNGKLMNMQNGNQTEVTEDATLQNGTKISSTGTVTWPNGKTQTLKEGDRIDMNGMVHSNNMTSKMKMKDDNGKWKDKNKSKPTNMDTIK